MNDSLPSIKEETIETIEGTIRPPIKRTRRGRPPKSEVALYKKPKGTVGRPKGDNARMLELKARLLATDGNRILNKVINIALDDEHQGQMAALRMCVDRMLPLGLFEKDARSGKSAVTINIMGVDGVQISGNNDENTIEMEEVTNET